MEDEATIYAHSVINGDVSACKYVQQACARHIRDLDRNDYVYDTNAAQHVYRFFELLKHVKGPDAGKHFALQPFQKFILGSIFGWKNASTGYRRFQQAYVEVPRKNGKSFLCSGVGLYGLVADQEGGPEIYSVATKMEQANIVWKVAVQIAKGCVELGDLLKLRAHEILNDANNGLFRALASDSKTLDGLNPHIAIADELHAWQDSHLYFVIRDGMGARRQPLLFAITTAGATPQGICFDIRTHVVKMLSAEPEFDDRIFGFISTIDEGDEWDDPKAWHKANPLLGSALTEEAFKAEVEQAKKIPSRKTEFINVRLNIWINSQDAWLDVEQWRRLAHPIDESELRNEPCYVGLDMSSTTDMTAIVLLFPDIKNKIYVLPKFFLPRKALLKRERESINFYRHWLDDNWLQEAGDSVISKDRITKTILNIARDYEVERVCVDPWHAATVVADLEEHGVPCIAVRQGYEHIGSACKDLESLIVSEEMHHNGNPIMSWNVANIIVDRDPNGNIKPNKKKSTDKIDGISALLTALAVMKKEYCATYTDEYLPPGHPSRHLPVDSYKAPA